MPREFEFRIIRDEGSFLSLLDANDIPYTLLPKRMPRVATRPNRAEQGIRNIKRRTAHINEIAIQLLITLTPLALQTIWKWYKGRHKRKGSQLSVVYDGNLLDLDPKNMKILMSALTETSKVKKRRKRGEPK